MVAHRITEVLKTMKKLVFPFMLGIACSFSAFATSTLELKVDGSIVGTVSGNQITYSNPNVDGWDLFIVVGVSTSPITDNPALDLTSLTATCGAAGTTTCSANPLHISLSDMNFDTVVTSLSTTYSSTQTGSGTTSQSAYLSASNVEFANTTLIGTSPAFTAPGGVATETANLAAGPSPYSLTLNQVFTDLGTGPVSFSVDGNLSGTSVPEPGAVVLFGTVLILAASKLRRYRAS